jgi:hypothetical protein
MPDMSNLQVGSRVLVEFDSSQHTGSIASINNDECRVSIDGFPFPKSFVDTHLQFVEPINSWYKANPKSITKRVDKSPLDLFLQATPKRFDINAAYAMWLWANMHIFNSSLQTPNIVDSMSKMKTLHPLIDSILGKKTKNLTGLCVSGAGSNKISIYANLKTIISLKGLFETIVHEMVHQYNFTHNLDDGHGPNFMKWAPTIKRIAHIELSVYHHRNMDSFNMDDDVNTAKDTIDGHPANLVDSSIFGPAPNEQDYEKVKPFYIILVRVQGAWTGFWVDDAGKMAELKSSIPQNSVAYVRQSDLYGIRKLLKKAPSSFNTAMFSRNIWQIPEKAAETMIKNPMFQVTSRVKITKSQRKLLLEGISL